MNLLATLAERGYEMEEEQARSEVRRQLEQVLANVENVEQQNLDVDEAQSALRESVEMLQEMQERLESPMVDTALGECRLEVPYAPIRPVRDENNVLRWCCTHDPEHC